MELAIEKRRRNSIFLDQQYVTAFNDQKRSSAIRRTALTLTEELRVVEFVLRFADKGLQLNCRHLNEASSIDIDQMGEMREKFPFRGGIPGDRWIRSFYCIHKKTASICNTKIF